MLLRVCVGWSCSLNNLWRVCRRIYLHHVNDPQVRLLRWGVLSLDEHQGHLVTLQDDEKQQMRGFYQAEDSFWIFTSECMFVCLCMFLLRLSFGDIRVCFAPWEWCRAWRLLQAETTRRLSWSECGDDTSVNLRRTRPGGDEMVLLGDFKMKKQRNKRKKWGRSDRLRA